MISMLISLAKVKRNEAEYPRRTPFLVVNFCGLSSVDSASAVHMQGLVERNDFHLQTLVIGSAR